MTIEGQQFAGPAFDCAPAQVRNHTAEEFCQGRVSPETGKSGVNSMSITGKCLIPQAEEYGYGYGYGTPVPTSTPTPPPTPTSTPTSTPDDDTPASSSQKMDESKKSVFSKMKFWKK